MQKPSVKLRKTLDRAVTNYEKDLSLGLSYLHGRGITEATATTARLGVVTSPEPGHEPYMGRVSIPYLDMKGVYGLKFRCMVHADCKTESCVKYLALPGLEVGVYGVTDADSTEATVHVTEGEFDRLIVRQVFGQPALGIPGVNLWMPHHPFHLGGFERVIVWPDGDKAGLDLANRIRNSVRGVEVMPIPKGHDVSSFFLEHGADALRAMAGVEDEND